MRTLVRVLLAAGLCALAAALVSTQETIAALDTRAREAEAAGDLPKAFGLWLETYNAGRPTGMTVEALLYIDDAAGAARRERLASIAARLPAAPPLPDEAERLSTGAAIELKEARDEAGLEQAGVQLARAIHAAPWVPALAYNLALVQEKLGVVWNAVHNFRVYLASQPADAADITTRVRELEYRLDRGKEHFWITFDVFRDGMKEGAVEFIVGHEQAIVAPRIDGVFAVNFATSEVLRLSGPPGSPITRIPLAEYAQSGERRRLEWEQINVKEWNRNNKAIAEAFDASNGVPKTTVLPDRHVAGIDCVDLQFAFPTLVLRVCKAPPDALKMPPALARGLQTLFVSNLQWSALAYFGLQFADPSNVAIAISTRLQKEIPARVATSVFPKHLAWTATRITRGLTVFRISDTRVRVMQRDMIDGKPSLRSWGTP